MQVLAISGSLRKDSFNTRLIHAAQELAPDGMNIVMADLAPLPLYNDDVRLAGYPPAVAAFRDAIRAADALLIATPEYNYSVSGVLKNAIDWASRPPDQPLAGKPLAIMGASNGMSGTMRAQYHLRQICVFVDLLPLNKPEVMVRNAGDKFDADGRLKDEDTRKHIRALLEALSAWTARLKR